MPIIRIDAVQGHATPKGYQSPRGPFPPEIFARNPRAEDSVWSDSVHETYADTRMFRCRDCESILYEDELNSHFCGEEED